MRKAKISISTAWLVELLNLPEGSTIENVRMGFDCQGKIHMVVNHHSLPKVVEGEPLPRATVEFEKTFIASAYKIIKSP